MAKNSDSPRQISCHFLLPLHLHNNLWSICFKMTCKHARDMGLDSGLNTYKIAAAMEVDPPTDDDPVIAEYNVYMTPQLKEQLLLLQYHTRERSSPYNAASRALPSELRIKPKTGFMEVDIGVSTTANFDKIKGLQWGQALKHAKDSKAKGFGLSSGFGKGNVEGDMKVLVSGEGRKKNEDADIERMMREFDTRLDSGRVLVKQTLGGQIKRPEQDRPYHMAGTFKGSEYCHVLFFQFTIALKQAADHTIL